MADSLEQKTTTEDMTETDFSVKSETDDVVLCVEGKKLHFPKVVLILASPVFNKVFTTDFKEKYTDELELKDKKYEDVLQFLKCFHPSVQAQVTMSNVFAVVPLAHEYMVRPLKNKCVVVVASSSTKATPVETLCYYLYIANKFQLEALEEKCRILAGQKSDESYRAEFYAAAGKYQVPFESQAIVYNAMLKTQSKIVSKALMGFNKVTCPCGNPSFNRAVESRIDDVVNDIKKLL